jgi:hypothetical protein
VTRADLIAAELSVAETDLLERALAAADDDV